MDGVEEEKNSSSDFRSHIVGVHAMLRRRTATLCFRARRLSSYGSITASVPMGAIPRVLLASRHAPLQHQPQLIRTALLCGTGLTLGRLLLHPQQPASCSSSVEHTALQRRASEQQTRFELEEWRQQDVSLLGVCKRSIRSLFRALYLCALIGPLLLTMPLRNWTLTSEAWWWWCVRTLEHSGALLIKLAQWSSSRPDLFGEDACDRFKHLQDAARPHAWDASEQRLEALFGSGWREILRLESHTPIGSGCIAQVYKGSLLIPHSHSDTEGEWRPVAIKVVHPDVREFIQIDMDLLRGLGWFVERCSARSFWLSPSGMLDEFASLLLMQLDLTVEARHLDRFLHNFPPDAGDGKRCLVTFPQPFHPYVSRDVLVESFIDGEPFLHWAHRVQPPQSERQRICYDGIDAVIKMIFIDNFVHGDLHPGNIFVTPTGQLAFLDAGIAIRFSERDHQHLIDVLSAFITYDGYEGGRLMAEHSSLDAGGGAAYALPTRLDEFCRKIQKMVEMARDEPSFFDKIGECISIIFRSACEHQVRLQSSFINIALAVKVVEGSVIQVDPLSVVAPRAKAVVMKESMRRKGEELLGRTLSEAQRLREEEERKLEEEWAALDERRRREAQALVDSRKAAKPGP